jgi:monoamine oxidase
MTTSPTSTQNQIAIIGAGLAGLTAAYRLNENGYTHFDVYEARERVGGRVLSARLKHEGMEATIELGGQNIADGGTAPQLKSLVKELGLTLLEDKIEIKPAFYDDQTRNYTNIFSLHAELFPIEKHMELKRQIQDLAERSSTIEDILIALFPDKGLLYRSLSFKFSGYEGGIPSNVSAKAWEDLYYMLCGGVAEAHTSNMVDYTRIEGGNAKLALELAKKLEKKIHLDYPLESMQLNERNRILLSFKGGMQKEYDKVILAIPCSIYKDIEIDSRLISVKRISFIHKVPYGGHAKVLIPVNQESLLYNQVLTDEMSAFFSEESSSWILYLPGQEKCSFKNLIPDLYKKSLEVLTTLYPTLSISETLPQEAQGQVQFQTYHYPVTHFWKDDLYAQGSYSYRSPVIMGDLNIMEEYKGERIRAPYSPINNRIFFAGEHTAVDAYLGTLEGAVESGERVARMILAAH